MMMRVDAMFVVIVAAAVVDDGYDDSFRYC